ncbi:B-type cyclin [Coemansia sp. Benny D115]|nr:B-type cyclin [Coemansia sp. Benny D115]
MDNRQNEARREFLYNNLSKHLNRLNQNFDLLNRNIQVMKDQTELAQRMAISHASMFMGAKDVFETQTTNMFQNKSSTLPLRSRIPIRRAAVVTDENKVGGTRAAKDSEPAGKAAVIGGTAKAHVSMVLPTTAATVGVKAGGAFAAKTFSNTSSTVSGIATRSRGALENVVNVKVQGAAGSNIVKPTRLTATTVTATATQNGPAAFTRARQASAIARPANSNIVTRSSVIGTRPISKPSASFGVRRPRPVVATAAAAVIANTTKTASSTTLSSATAAAAASAVSAAAAAPTLTKRQRSHDYDSNAEDDAMQLGKHTRSGRVARTLRAGSESTLVSDAASSSDKASVGSEATTVADPSSDDAMQISPPLDSGAVFEVEKLSAKEASGLNELKFVDVDCIDYALAHTGLLNEQPITMEEIEEFDADIDPKDQSVVPEFSDDIFGYMREMELKMMPDAQYISRQPALTWSTRSILIEWLIDVHDRFHLLPETLYLCINFVDRFFSIKEAPINQLQLIGAVCLLLAAKYEEIRVPSVKDIVFIVSNNVTEKDILRAERIILRLLNFDLGWPGPMSFLRRVSKADNYDLTNRTLAKYLIEVTLLDPRFIAVPCSKTVATAHYLATRFLGKNDWTRRHAYYSGYFESELLRPAKWLLEMLLQPHNHKIVFEKYASKNYYRASEFVYTWLGKNDPRYLLTPTGYDLAPEEFA